MRDTLIEIARRLREMPTRAGELVLKRGELSDRLHRTLDVLKEIEARTAGEVASEKNGEGKPAYPNEAARSAEIRRRLQADPAWLAAMAEADRLRQELRAADAEIEQVGRRHRSDCQVAYLAASLLSAGLRAEAEAVLAAYGTEEVPEEPQAEPEPPRAEAEPKPEAQGQAPKADGLETGTFTVLEVRAGKSEGTVRAYCEGPDGKTAVYAKNGAAKVLSGAVGRKVEVRFRRLDKGLFAVEARPVA